MTEFGGGIPDDRLDYLDCLARAAECEEEAARAADDPARRVYQELARHWRLLAEVARKGRSDR
jgi:hypothetical protein